jgi:hypothetical protein
MAVKKNPKEGADFTGMRIDLEEKTLDLCNETYAATIDDVPESKLRELIKRAETHIAEYKALLEHYTGGRRTSLERAGNRIGSLGKYAQTLKAKVEGR